MESDESASPWRSIADAVEGGQLHLDRGAAARCAQHCSDLVTRLAGIRDRAGQLGEVQGFGPLPSGIALAAKFSRKAVGGPNSMVGVLTAHIAEVEAMRAVFEKIEARYAAAEQRSVDGFAAIQR